MVRRPKDSILLARADVDSVGQVHRHNICAGPCQTKGDGTSKPSPPPVTTATLPDKSNNSFNTSNAS